MTMIPEDVLFQILLWLPVVSLLRFKLVCKSWLSLIQTSTFISQHLHHHHRLHLDNEKEGTIILLDPPRFDIFTLSFSFFSGNNFQLSKVLDLPHRFHNELRCPKIIASCNGIICLEHDSHSHHISLWNPATKQFKLLPELLPVHVPIPRGSCIFRFSFGFGFDANTNDYKVVRIIIIEDGFTSIVIKSQVEVYSLSIDSWTTLDAILPVNYIYSHPKAPFQDGIYCWLARLFYVENETSEEVILSFDFSNQVFGTVPLPDVYVSPVVGTNLMLALLKEKIACMECVFDSSQGENWHCKIWVLNQYGVKESWTKLYTIALVSNAFCKGVSNNGNIIWIKREPGTNYNDSKLCLCDPVTQELKDLPYLPYQGYINQQLQVVFYKESLVSIKSANGAINGVTCEDLSENCQPSA